MEGGDKKLINVDGLFGKQKKEKIKPPTAASDVKKALMEKLAKQQVIAPPIEESIKELAQIQPTLPPPPVYSSLKGGSRPTFRQLNKTIRTPPPTRTVEKHYVGFGKQTKRRKISVFLKNIKDREHVGGEIRMMQTQDLDKIKEFLVKRGLIKIGSTAPEPLIRELYTNCLLAGDILNKNPENLFYNFMNESKK